jgi:hypothetical protein
VWALYCRSLLLWNFCNRLLTPGPNAPHQTEVDADALQESWNEAQAIQDSLEMHICNYETGVAYLCQEYIYKYDLNPPSPLQRLMMGIHLQHTYERHAGAAQVGFVCGSPEPGVPLFIFIHSFIPHVCRMQGLSREISTTPGPLFNRKQARHWSEYARVQSCRPFM